MKLNDALFQMARRFWPETEASYYRIEGLLYHALGPLFTEYSDFHRYWIVATGPGYFEELDQQDEVVWSARKAMQAGDKIFIYRTSPISAITDIFEAVEDAYFHPISAWDGFWVRMKRVCRLPALSFAGLRTDPVLRDWGVVRKQFTGTVADPVTFKVYNRLLELLPGGLRRKHGLEPEPVAEHGASGEFESEAAFEDRVITPLLKRWDIKHERQYLCSFVIGSQNIRGRIDYLLYRRNEPYSLIENKVRILNGTDLDKAVSQAKSYALQIGVDHFVVASPEGYWVYRLDRNQETRVCYVASEEAPDSEDLLRSHIAP